MRSWCHGRPRLSFRATPSLGPNTTPPHPEVRAASLEGRTNGGASFEAQASGLSHLRMRRVGSAPATRNAKREGGNMGSVNPSIDLAHDGDIAVVTIDNPPVNALKHEVRAGLIEAFQRVRHDAGVKAAVLA